MMRLLPILLVSLTVLTGCTSGQTAGSGTTGRITLQQLNQEMIHYARRQNARALAPDPRDVFTDSWVYAVQRQNFLNENLQADVFSPWRDDILKNLEELIAELRRIGGLFMEPEELANAEAAVTS